MSRSIDRVRESDRRRRRVARLLAGLAWTVLLLLAAVAGPTGTPPVSAVGGPSAGATGTGGPGAGGTDEEESRLGWSLFHAAADQWQFGFALTQVGPPWQHDFPLVSKLRPRAEAPRYRGKLPLNTIIAPATPTDVHPAGAYGWRVAPDIGVEELHNGADVAAASGTPVLSALDGVVRAVFWDVWGGNRVEVSHVGDMVTTYNHLQDVRVSTGDKLRASQELGTVGATGARVTGPHLHFETWVDGKAVDPQSFDWVDGDRIIPAPRAPRQEPPTIPRGGRGDNSTIDVNESCPYERSDPSRCRPPESVPTTRPGPWPPLEQCTDLLYGRYNCEPLVDPVGQEDCPSAVQGGRLDCPPVVWPELTDPSVCTEVLYGRYNCEPLVEPVGQEDCPSAVQGGRLDCPPVVWPELTDPSVCTDLLYGRYNCEPLADPVGQEDCPSAAGGRLDCPPEQPVPGETPPTAPAGEGGGTDPGPDVTVPDLREPDIALPEVPLPNPEVGLRRMERPSGPAGRRPGAPPRKLKKH